MSLSPVKELLSVLDDGESDQVVAYLEKRIAQDIKNIIKTDEFYQLPIQKIISLLKKGNIIYGIEKPNDDNETLEEVIQKLIEKKPEEAILILNELDFPDLSIDECHDILTLFTCCPICKQIQAIIDENANLPNRDIDYELQQKDKVIEEKDKIIEKRDSQIKTLQEQIESIKSQKDSEIQSLKEQIEKIKASLPLPSISSKPSMSRPAQPVMGFVSGSNSINKPNLPPFLDDDDQIPEEFIKEIYKKELTPDMKRDVQLLAKTNHFGLIQLILQLHSMNSIITPSDPTPLLIISDIEPTTFNWDLYNKTLSLLGLPLAVPDTPSFQGELIGVYKDLSLNDKLTIFRLARNNPSSNINDILQLYICSDKNEQATQDLLK